MQMLAHSPSTLRHFPYRSFAQQIDFVTVSSESSDCMRYRGEERGKKGGKQRVGEGGKEKNRRGGK